MRKAAFIGIALVLMVCVAMSFQYRDEILGGFALRGAQASFEERVRQAVGPDAAIEYRDQSDRSALLAVRVPASTFDDDAAQARLLDAIWQAYAEEFAGGGMPLETIVIAGELDPQLKVGGSRFAAVADLAARTGVPAPPLHPMYADKGYFDASKEAVPADDAGTDE